MPTFFYSAQDPAGYSAAESLRAKCENEPLLLQGRQAWRFDGFDLVELPYSLLEAQVVDEFKTDLAIFLSKHKSASAQPCFTTHVTGNWGPAEHGGKEKTLSRASAFWLKRFFFALKEQTNNAFLEATHHGPTLETPSLFVEIGSSEEEWIKRENGVALAEAVLSALERKDGGKVTLGFGGTHYCSSFTYLFDEGWALSHIASKHSLDFVTKELIQQATEKTVEPVEMVFLDWKGCNKEQRELLVKWFEELGLEWRRL